MRARLLAAACLALATAACGSTSTAARPVSSPVTPEGGVATAGPGARGDRAIVQRAGLRLVTDSLRRVHRAADSLAVAWGGYVGDAELRETWLRMSLRVPGDSLNPALDRLSALGRATHRTVRREDVTEQVVDVEARLGTLRAVRDRLRHYLQRADAMADLVQVERELARVQGEIDVLEARQRALGSRIALAEIGLEVERPRVLGPLGWLLAGAASLIEKLFVIR
ncbi:MAG TPA: DUF4349 domain-containing protein [Longimicrobium sp.]